MFNPMNRVRITKINGKDFQIYLLPAGEGIKRATQLAKAFAPTLASLVESSSQGVIDYSSVAYTIAEGLDEIDVLEVCSALLRDLSVSGQAVKLDDYFMGNYGEFIEIMAFALKENFESFFEAKGFVEKFLPKRDFEESEAE